MFIVILLFENQCDVLAWIYQCEGCEKVVNNFKSDIYTRSACMYAGKYLFYIRLRSGNFSGLKLLVCFIIFLLIF